MSTKMKVYEDQGILVTKGEQYDAYSMRVRHDPELRKEINDVVRSTPVRTYNDLVDQTSMLIAQVLSGDLPPVVVGEVTKLMEFQLTAISAEAVMQHSKKTKDERGFDVKLLLEEATAKSKAAAAGISAKFTLDATEE